MTQSPRCVRDPEFSRVSKCKQAPNRFVCVGPCYLTNVCAALSQDDGPSARDLLVRYSTGKKSTKSKKKLEKAMKVLKVRRIKRTLVAGESRSTLSVLNYLRNGITVYVFNAL